MLPSFSQFSFTAALVAIFAGTLLDAKNVIIDDTDTSKITYSSGWLTGNSCSGCFAQPDKNQAFDGTWHDVTAAGTADISFTFTFTGTSVEARYIAIDIIETAFVFTTGTNVSYSIDGVQRGISVRNPTNVTSYVYNQLLFNVTGLENAEHTLKVDLLKPSVLLLDYLIYEDGSGAASSVTTSLASSTSSTVSSTPSNTDPAPKPNSGPIIAGVVTALVVIVLGAVIIWFFLKRRRRHQTSQRGALPALESDDAHAIPFLPTSAQSMSMAATTQTGQTFRPPPSATSHTATYTSSAAESNTSRAPLTGMTVMHTASNSLTPTTTPPSSPGMTNLSSLHSLPETHHGSRINEKQPPGRRRQGATAGRPPPGTFYTNVVSNLVQAEMPNEPVEEGRMSRHASTVTTLPPYSPGAFEPDGDAPPLPQRP